MSSQEPAHTAAVVTDPAFLAAADQVIAGQRPRRRRSAGADFPTIGGRMEYVVMLRGTK